MIRPVVRGLLIEDSDVSAAQTLGILNSSARVDYHLAHVRDKSQALPILKNPCMADFRLVILDLILRNGEGKALVREIREAMPPDATLVILTIKDDEDIGVECLEAGADAFMGKGSYPNSELFLHTIRYAIAKRDIIRKGAQFVAPACAILDRHESKIRTQEEELAAASAIGETECPFMKTQQEKFHSK